MFHVYSAVLWTQWDFCYKSVHFYSYLKFFSIWILSSYRRFFDTCVHLVLESRADQSVSLPNKTREQHKREVGSLSSVIGSASFCLSLSSFSPPPPSPLPSLYLIFFIFYPCLKQIELVLSKSGELAENAPWSQVKYYSWLAR